MPKSNEENVQGPYSDVEPVPVEVSVKARVFYQPNCNGQRGDYHETEEGAEAEGLTKIHVGQWEHFIVYKVWCKIDDEGFPYFAPKGQSGNLYR